ncbi:MAG: restriction endonuclease subunit R [Deltaproteobacteria bacterium]|nr:restriction endonuclease subunit R [Deltaproteobacteria bacterium]
MLQLKGYQEKALQSLRMYLHACDDLLDASLAFYKVTEDFWGQGLPYRAIKEPSELADIPYVCLRLPTGGGKTLLGCHAIALANKEFLKRDNSLVLWLVPSNAIKDQTLNALRDRDHAYRQALDSTLGQVTVMDISEALYLQQGVLMGSTVVIVSTLQAFRVEDKDGRKVYESAGTLQHHFQNLPSEIYDKLDRDESGIAPYSLANVMRIQRPLVIVDEAHNARTDLSFDTLARFRPSAIIEFTATPASSKNPSNVLHSVSAAELKAENMIKLPIRLETQMNWQALLSDAIAQRVDLEKKADIERRKTGEYIRPIMLIQAQPRRHGRETLTVDVIEKSLIEDHHTPENHIARATGEEKELAGINLSDDQCEIRYVITVQALREGWDCPFAYILCSVAEQRSIGAVEQILGRVLRLPYCKPRKMEELNRAYAFVASPNFVEAAQGLVDALVENGFNRQEAKDFIRPVEVEQGSLGLELLRFIPPSKIISLPEVPDPEQLSSELRSKIEIDQDNKTVTLKGVLYPEEQAEVMNLFVAHDVKDTWIKEVRQYNAEVAEVLKSPSERGLHFHIPVLCIKRGEQLELFEEDHLLEKGWDLKNFDAKLTFQELSFLSGEGGQFGEIDVGEEGRVKSRFIPDLNRQLQLIEVVENWTDAQLIHWLDRNLLFMELASQEKEIFLTEMISDLLDHRGLNLSQLVRKKFELRKIAEQKIKTYRYEARQRIHQELLFAENGEQAVVSPEKCFTFPPDQYPTRSVCPASVTFNKHYYPKVGELEGEGEEFLCAQFIDQMEEVEFWVRNLDRQERFSFWLQTATDKFYPDFACKLKDGRYLVVEYKGADRWSNDDSKEKRRLGELWALKSDGKCLFVMPKGKDWESIKSIVK